MANVFIFSAGDPPAITNFQKTIVDGCELAGILPLIPDPLGGTLKAAYADGKCYLWGEQETEAAKRSTWQAMLPGDWVLGYREQSVVATLDSPQLAEKVWPGAAEPFRLIYFLTKPIVLGCAASPAD